MLAKIISLLMDPSKQYLTTKLNPILEPMVTEILTQKPNDLVEFMIAYLKKLQKPGQGRSRPNSRREEAGRGKTEGRDQGGSGGREGKRTIQRHRPARKQKT